MPIHYSTHLIVLGVQTLPKSTFNLDLFQKQSENCTLYRGTAVYPHKDYTLKFTKNSYIHIFLKNSFPRTLSDIEEFITTSCSHILRKYCECDIEKLVIDVINVQISFTIHLKNEELQFIDFCLRLVKLLQGEYIFEVKESNSYESVWLNLNQKNLNQEERVSIPKFSSFRIKHNKTTYTIAHTYIGSCITKNVNQFIELCHVVDSVL